MLLLGGSHGEHSFFIIMDCFIVDNDEMNECVNNDDDSDVVDDDDDNNALRNWWGGNCD